MHTHSDRHKHHKWQKGAWILVLEVNGKVLSKSAEVGTVWQLNSLQNIRDAIASNSIYNMTIIFIHTVCFPDFMYLVKQYLEIGMFCTYRLPHYLYNGWKTSAWIVRLVFWVGVKQSTNTSIVNVNLWWCCCVVDAESWNNRVCQHSVLPAVIITSLGCAY